MKLLVSLAALLLASMATAESIAVRSIQPREGSIAGGTEVRIEGDDLSAPILCVLPCPAEVRFDGRLATLIEESRERLVVRTPPGDEGLADVTIRRNDGAVFTIFNAFTYSRSRDAGYARVLLPVVTEATAGSGGSRWRTELWIHNRAPRAVTIAPALCPDGGACPAVYPLTFTVPAGDSLKDPRIQQTSDRNPGVVLYVQNDAQMLEWQLRLFDESSVDIVGGAELPVIREEDFHRTTLDLLNIPTDGRYRQTLRIYDLTASGTGAFDVRFYSLRDGEDELLRTERIRTSADATAEFRSEPGYAQVLRLSDTYPNLRNRGPIRIEISPVEPGARFWAFVSVTNDASQAVTIISPQR